MHWYIIKDGVAQRYIQLTKKGVESKRYNHGQALADGAVVGATDTLKVLGDVGGLLQWTAGLGMDAGIKAMSENITVPSGDPSIKARAKEIHTELSERAANEGTIIHDSIENYLKDELNIPVDQIQLTACLSAKRFLDGLGITSYTPEHCFVWRGWINIYTGDYVVRDGLNQKPDGEGWVVVAVGGTSDVVSDIALVDWKSVEDSGYGFRKPKAKEAAQLALYRLGFGKPMARCINVYFDRRSGSLVAQKEWTETELRKGLIMVAMAVRYSEIEDSLEG